MQGLGGIGAAVLGVAVAIWVVARQVLPRRLSWRMMLVAPAVLAYMAYRELPAGRIPAGQGLELGLELALALACGLWQGATLKLSVKNGQWYVKGGWAYLVGWVAFLGGDITLHLVLEGPTAFASGLSSPGMWISLVGAAAVWLVRALWVVIRHPETVSAGAATDAGRA